MNHCLKTAIFSLLAICAQISLAGEFSIIQITQNEINDDGPTVNDFGRVVWQSGSFNSFEIITYHKGITTQLTDNNFQENHPQINNSNQIIWDGTIDSSSVYEIFYRENGETTRLTYAPSDSFIYSNLFPRINKNGAAVWKQFATIMIYDGVNILPIAEEVYGSPSPNINDNNQVTWVKGSGLTSEVFFYDGSNLIQITDNAFEERFAQINNQGMIVWEVRDGDDWDIVLFDGSEIKKITDNDTSESPARINNRGHLVWSGFDGNDSEIYFYDGIETHQVTNNEMNDFNPQLNDKGTIVWQGGDGATSHIFVYNDSTVSQLTTNFQPNWAPSISNTGYITWWGTDGDDRDIFLAKPINLMSKIQDLIVLLETPVTNGTARSIGPDDSASGRLDSHIEELHKLEVSIKNDNLTDACSMISVLLSSSYPEDASEKLIEGNNRYQINETMKELKSSIKCM